MKIETILKGIEIAIDMLWEGETLAKFTDTAIQEMDAYLRVNGGPNVWIGDSVESERVTRKLAAKWDRDPRGVAVMA